MRDDLITRIFSTAPDGIDMQSLWQEIDSLEPAQQPKVMHLLFDADGKPTGMTLKEAGQQVGVSGNRIHQIRNKVILRLRHPVRIRRYVPLWGA